MRIYSALAVGIFALGSMFACTGGGGDEDDLGGMGGGEADGSGGTSSTGGTSSSGGAPIGGDVEFFDLTGRIRFANFISDGTAGVEVDVYWGSTPSSGELVGSVPYGTVTEFLVPRRAENSILDEDEASYLIVPAGSTSAFDIFASGDEPFADETRLTIALAATDPLSGATELFVSSTTFFEHELSTPPSGSAHVYGWDNAWAPIEDFSFALVGTSDLCDPEDGLVDGGNLGVPAVIPDGTSGLTLFDANTECASGAPPADGEVEAGHSYVLLGEALSYDLDARSVILLEVGAD